MKNYHDLIEEVLAYGEESDDRTGVGTLSIFGSSLSFDLRAGFPAITTKKLAWKAVVSELIWFLSGSTNLYDLREILHGKQNRFNSDKKTIWDGNYNKQALELGYSDGEMGELYGAGWRDFGAIYLPEKDEFGHDIKVRIKGIDQVKSIIEEAKSNPSSRRLLVNAWNPSVIWNHSNNRTTVKTAALPPCHFSFQLNIIGDFIDLCWYQRSVDVGTGLPFNIASYALLTHIFGIILGKTPRKLVGHMGNVHLYKNHIESAKIQISRQPYDYPILVINPELKTLDDFVNSAVSDFSLKGYNCHGPLNYPMAV